MKNAYQVYALSVIIAFIVAYLLMPLVAKLAFRIGAIDRPSARKVQTKPMPRLGGTGIFVAFVIVVLATQDLNRSLIGILLGAAVIFLVGVLDDIYRLSPWTKLAAQISAALIVVYFGVRVHVMTNPFDGVFQLGVLSIPLTLLWVIGITNAVNLIDGTMGQVIALLEGLAESASSQDMQRHRELWRERVLSGFGGLERWHDRRRRAGQGEDGDADEGPTPESPEAAASTEP